MNKKMEQQLRRFGQLVVSPIPVTQILQQDHERTKIVRQLGVPGGARAPTAQVIEYLLRARKTWLIRHLFALPDLPTTRVTWRDEAAGKLPTSNVPSFRDGVSTGPHQYGRSRIKKISFTW